MSTPDLHQGYFLAGNQELERLALQAGVWEADAEAMLERIGLAPGWSCADLGCGGVCILRPLSRRTGQRGRVVGLDADSDLLDAAQASFDLVHARFLAPHVESPDGTLSEMIALAKPGGTSWNFYPPCPAWPRLLSLLE